METKSHKSIFRLNYEAKMFVLGIVLGSLLGAVWQDFFHHYHFFPLDTFNLQLTNLKQDADKRLLSYIEGEWESPIKDVKVIIHTSKMNDISTLEIIKDSKIEKHYNIVNINSISGLMGIVSIDLCDESKVRCIGSSVITVQINKIFGIDDTITISYDSRFANCLGDNNECTRAFKRINE